MGFAVIAAVLAALVVFVVAMYYWLREEGKTVSGRLNDPLIENDALERGRAPRSDDLEGSGAGIALQVTAPKARMALIDSKELEFGDKLAEGGAAVVYAGSYKFNDIAIKKVKHLSKQKGGKGNEDEVMLKEAELMRNLKHPNIVHFIALSLHEGMVCLVMDLAVNGSFRDVLDRASSDYPENNDPSGGELSLSTKLRIIYDAAKGLAYLHKLRPVVIHRDLKAANVLLDERWQAKLTDFGISRAKMGAEQALTSFSGTVAWMAPELLRGDKTYTEAVDIYSLAMVIFEALTLETPFDGFHVGQLVMLVANQGSRPQLWHTPSSAEKAAQGLMVRMWAAEAAERPSADDVVREMRSICGQAS